MADPSQAKRITELLALEKSLGFVNPTVVPSLKDVERDVGLINPMEKELELLYNKIGDTTPDQALKKKEAAKLSPLSDQDISPESIKEVEKKNNLNILGETPISQKHLATTPGALAVAQDDIENIGYFENLARGMGEMFLNRVVGGTVRFVGTTADAASDILSELIPGQIEFDFTGDTPKIDWRFATEEEIDQESPLIQFARDFEGVKLGYKPGTTWEDVKERPLAAFMPFALEQGIVSVPEMAAAILNFPAYVLTLTGVIGQARAVNEGKRDATVEDLFKAAPAAIAVAWLDRLGGRGILGIDDALKFGGIKEVGKATIKGGFKESITEGAQEFGESVGETLGTKKGFTLMESLERALAGTVGGLGFGGTVRLGTASVQSIKLRKIRQVKKTMDKLNKLSRKSKYKERDSEGASRLQTEVLRDSGIEAISLPIDKVIEMAQTHEEGEAAFISDLDVASQMGVALNQQQSAEEVGEARKETIVGAAIEVEGQVFSGVNHGEAMDAASAALGFDINEVDTEGFVTNHGRYVSRNEAEEIALEREQVKEENLIFGPGHGLGSEDFEFNPDDTREQPVLELTEDQILPTFDAIPSPFNVLTDEPIIELTEEQVVEPGRVGITLDAFVKHILGTNKYDAVSEDVVYGILRSKMDAGIAVMFADAEPTLPDPAEVTTRKPKLKTKTEMLKKLKIATTKLSIQTLIGGFKAGIKTAQTNTKAAQSSLIDLINKSGLLPEDKGKFNKAIKNIQTLAQLNKELPKIQGRIVRILENRRRKELKAAIKKVLKPVKSPKKGEGKFDADTQKVLDRARVIMGMDTIPGSKKFFTVKAAAAQLEENIFTDNPSPDMELENGLLAIAANSDQINSNDLEGMLLDLNAIVNEGRKAAQIRQFKKQIKVNNTVDAASAAVTQGTVLEMIDTSTLMQRVRAKFKEGGASIGSMVNAWEEVIDITFNKEGIDAEALIATLDMTHHTQDVKEVVQKWSAELERLGMEAYGVDKQSKVMDELYDSAVKEVVGGKGNTFINVRGEEVILIYSRQEARKLFMELQDPTIRDAVFHKDGNAYTAEMTDAIVATLTEGDMNYANAQIEFYRKAYKDINAVYRRMYGVNLPFNEFYSPILRDKGIVPLTSEGDKRGEEHILLEEMKYRRSIPGSLKKRSANKFPIEQRSDVGAMMKWQHDMSTFIATGEQSLFLHTVFSNSRLRKQIAHFHGKNMVEQIDGLVRDFNSGHRQRGRVSEQWANRFNRVFARSVLALKGTIGTKQLVSYFAMSENIPAHHFVINSVRFLASPRKWIKKLYGNSPLMKHRGSSLEFENAKIGASEPDVLRLRKSQDLDDFLMFFIRYGDRGPIYMGGAARYMYLSKKKGWSDEKIRRDFESITSSTQQSTDLDRMSDLQRGGPIARTFTMFLTARLSLIRGQLRAIRQRPTWLGGRGKITAREFGKRMAIYQFIIPMLIQAVASGFRFEKDEQIRAMLLGQLNGFAIFGDVLFWAVSEQLVEDNFDWGRDLPIVDTMKDAMRGAEDAINATSMEELLLSVSEVADAAGVFLGKPVEQVKHMFIGGYKISEGKVEEGAKLMWGLSPSIAEESSKRRNR